MLPFIQTLAVVGMFLSLYARHVERNVKRKKHYKALCDIDDHISCTKAFSSEYGHLLGVSNSVMGLLFYVAVFIIAFTSYAPYIFYLSLVSLMISAYLAYTLYTK